MVKVNNGFESIRDFLANDITTMSVGTGQTAATLTDSTLENEIHETAAAVEPLGSRRVMFTVELNFDEANAELNELGTKNVEGELQDRISHSTIVKDESRIIEYELIEEVQNA